MRPVAMAASIMFVLAVAAVAVPSLTLAAPPITQTEAIETAQQLAARVGGYSARHPDDPGAFTPWAREQVEAGAPLLIHSYPALEPSYYYIPLTSQRTGAETYVTVDAVTGDWQAFGERTGRASFPKVTRAHAARRGATELGTAVSPADLRVVSMPNKHLYWYWSDGPAAAQSREFFINLSDPSDVHHAPDAEIAPPQPQLGTPRAKAVQGDPGAGTPIDRSGTRFPPAYNISSVPYHVQVTSYNCGPAASEMVMDYYGADIDQEDIADVANCTPSNGSYARDVRRTGHFSAISAAFQNASLQGYNERKLGYGALSAWWSYPGTGDPDYPDRYNDLKELVSTDFPVLVLTWYDTTQEGGHFRVVKGYDDATNVFIVHDPWYTPPYQGPDVNFNQATFVDNLWTCWDRWGTVICPWEVLVSAPEEVDFGETFTVQAIIYYHGPHPFEGQDPASSREVIIDTSPLFTLAPGETAIQTLPGSAPSGIGNLVTWDVVADTVESSRVISVMARGLISDWSTSYASYSDSIGGWGNQLVTIVNQSGIDDPLPMELVLHAARPSPFAGTTTMQLDVPGHAGHVRLAIYNVRGQLVRTLVDGALPPGRREFVWDGMDDTGRPVSAGAYFARCESDAGSATRKLVLMR
ncbi:C39 family peptidase [bacterium]|nr:C39 family peptidase [bacterium]